MIQNRVDFKFYNDATEFPDYGNWFVQSRGRDNTVCYAGDTSANVSKLPYGGLIPAGSTALCKDDGAMYVYSGKTGTAADWGVLVE